MSHSCTRSCPGLILGCFCRYAWECQTQEGGWGLDGVLREQSWKLRGIVNGIDTSDWSPSQDAHLRQDGYTTYDLASLDQGKAQCKAALQRVRPWMLLLSMWSCAGKVGLCQ